MDSIDDRINFLRNERSTIYINYINKINKINNELNSLIFKKNNINIENLKDKYIYYKNRYLKIKNVIRTTNGLRLEGCGFDDDDYSFSITTDDILDLYYDDYKDLKIISEKEFFDTLHEIYTKKWECIQN